VPVSGRVRVNIDIRESNGTTTNVNHLRAPLCLADWPRQCGLAARFRYASHGYRPRPADRPARTIRRGSIARWAQSLLVDLINPNADELAMLVGRDLRTMEQVLDAGRELIEGGLD